MYTTARGSHYHAIKFQETEGFQYYMLEQLSLFDVESFGLALFTSKLTQTKANAFVFKSLRELRVRLQDRKRQMYLRESELGLDLPVAGHFKPWPFAEYCQRKYVGQKSNSDAIWTVLQDEKWDGTTEVSQSLVDPEKVHIGLTGSCCESRPDCKPTASKLEALDFANCSCKRIPQTLYKKNKPMFQIQLDLGFRPIPTIENCRESPPSVGRESLSSTVHTNLA